MKIVVNGVEELPKGKQEALGQKILREMYYENIKVDGVKVEFVDE